MDTPLRWSRNLMLAASLAATPAAAQDMAKWRAQAARVEIVRDDWGIAHVTGKTDADAVFGAIYAQAEDDFARVEANYLTALGRTAEAEGKGAIWADLRQRLFVDPAELKAQYAASAPWLRRLMDAWAAGLNFYLATHPGVHAKVLTRFEPWMALSFTEGSIGGDIERISLSELADFYGGVTIAAVPPPQEPGGSNGIAIAPANTANGHALLLINPHTSFYFRSELQMTSGEGLNAYGASTWGQFFIYQGFNAQAGWMHTSSGVDSVDAFAETVIRGKAYFYGKVLRPLIARPVTIAWRQADGTLARRTFTTWATHHGPIVAERGGKWIAQSLMWKPVPALEQSWLRTKASDLEGYLKVAGRQANSSNDTIFADRAGEIAYLHPQFVPVRDNRFDYRGTVEGADPATDWRGLTPLAKLPQAVRPKTGWVYNSNNAPWGAAGADSPREADFPRYMDTAGENPRGLHATALLTGKRDWAPETLMAAAYDRYLPAFGALLPRLAAAYDALPPGDPRRARLAAPIDVLRRWDCRWSAESTATSLAVFWGDALRRDTGALVVTRGAILTPATVDRQLAALDSAIDRLTRDFGRWQVPWGAINRFQRLDDAIQPHFDDAKPSMPVPFVSALYGSLASFGARSYPNTRRYYGTSGNSFVAVVEFGARPRAWAVMAGGQNGTPGTPHFADQIGRYAAGALRRVYFEPADLVGHIERRYRPG
ncbi:penicillin acylase family protein [Sphingomonas sp.]|uniref:penicillin acylase family protein n=1 Tax=Sphingomonas sp. TaxID=28214 RepID=UPI0035BC0E75